MIVNMALTSAASIPLPTIAEEFDVPDSQLTWIVSAYPLSSGCLLLIFGRLADLYGRKKMFLAGMAWLTIFSLGVAFANNDITLDILRGLQGVGAAAQVPAALGILAHAFPPSKARSFAFATFAAGAPLGGACGLVFSGILTQLTVKTWRSTFYLITGLGAVCVVAGFFAIDPDLPSTEIDQRVDWIGATLVTAGLVLIVFVLTQGEIAPQQWKTPYIIALLIVGVFLVGLFLVWQHYLEKVNDDPLAVRSKWTPPPIMRLSLWGRANGRVAVVMAVAFLNFCCFQSWCYWSQLYYQNYEGRTPILTIIRLLPMNVSGVICNIIVANAVGRLPFICFMVSGTALTSVAPLLFAFVNSDAVYWAYGFPAACLAVVGADFVFAAGTLFCAKVALPHEQSLAGALFQTMTQLGTSFGLTISTIVYDRVLAQRSAALGVIVDSSGAGAPRSALLDSFHAAEWSNFAFGAFAAILSFVAFQNVGIVGHSDADSERTATSAEEERTVDEKAVGGPSAA
ncbi:putative efflux transporter [Mucidula mucida]|nr:putative efflux transporter [Mucidula mucida]